jgi:hypothetical protein
MSKPEDKPELPVVDSLRAAAEKRAAEAAVSAAAASASAALHKVADSALDAVESFLFGKVGGAEEAIRKDAARSPLERLRAEGGASAPEVPAPPVEDPVEVAKRQLEALKAARNAPPTPRPKTM